jgi:hypothetical protein
VSHKAIKPQNPKPSLLYKSTPGSKRGVSIDENISKALLALKNPSGNSPNQELSYDNVFGKKPVLENLKALVSGSRSQSIIKQNLKQET